MSRFSSLLAVALVLFVMAPASALSAEQAYTINTQPIPLRAWPSERAKAVSMLPPSSKVERVKAHSYTHVIYQTPDGKVKKGWILSSLLSAVDPNAVSVKALSTENQALKAQVAQLENDGSALSQKYKELTDKLNTLNTAYQALKSGSADYLKLKTEYASVKTGLDKARQTMQTLARENADLRFYHKIQWFLAGGLVLILGWLMGWSSAKLRRKRKQSYYL